MLSFLRTVVSEETDGLYKRKTSPDSNPKTRSAKDHGEYYAATA
ncbi:MAG: hypothetical protein WCI18_12350 [Pseudomonadota bacterium]